MLHNIKIAFRTLLKGRLYTLINILGLTLGITACMLVATVVLDELSYDKHWTHSEDLYRMVSISEDGTDLARKTGAVYEGLAPELKRSFPEVLDYSELYISPIRLKIDREDDVPISSVMLYTDSAVHHLLDVNNQLSRPYTHRRRQKNHYIRTIPKNVFPRYRSAGNADIRCTQLRSASKRIPDRGYHERSACQHPPSCGYYFVAGKKGSGAK